MSLLILVPILIGNLPTSFTDQFFSFQEMPQIVTPKKLKLNGFSGFGFSFSKEKDIDVDGNEFNDFATGAPFSNKAVLLKTRVVTHVTSDLSFSNAPSSVSNDTQCNVKYV